MRTGRTANQNGRKPLDHNRSTTEKALNGETDHPLGLRPRGAESLESGSRKSIRPSGKDIGPAVLVRKSDRKRYQPPWLDEDSPNDGRPGFPCERKRVSGSERKRSSGRYHAPGINERLTQDAAPNSGGQIPPAKRHGIEHDGRVSDQ